MPDMYHGEDYDLAGFAVGAVERSKKLSARLPDNQGFTAIGLPSSGLHSNGYSLVRKIIERAQPNLNDAPPFDDGDNAPPFIDLLLTPTKIYTDAVRALSNADLLSGACHITGGGFYENLPRGLPDNAKLVVDTSTVAEQKIFSWLKQAGNVPTREMYRTFNMGIGMVLFTENPSAAIDILQQAGEIPVILGEVTPRKNDEAQIIIKGIDD